MACRTSRTQRELLRIVRDPGSRAVHPDPSGRANGRGAYVCRDANCIQIATSRGLLAKALEAAVPATLAGELTTMTTEGGFIGQE